MQVCALRTPAIAELMFGLSVPAVSPGGCEALPDQVVLAHTPFRSLAANLGSKPILVAGMGEVAHVAATYGFKHVVTTRDLARASPSAVPFWKDRAGELHILFTRHFQGDFSWTNERKSG